MPSILIFKSLEFLIFNKNIVKKNIPQKEKTIDYFNLISTKNIVLNTLFFYWSLKQNQYFFSSMFPKCFQQKHRTSGFKHNKPWLSRFYDESRFNSEMIQLLWSRQDFRRLATKQFLQRWHYSILRNIPHQFSLFRLHFTLLYAGTHHGYVRIYMIYFGTV